MEQKSKKTFHNVGNEHKESIECDIDLQVSDTGGFRELGENVIQVAEPTTLYGACNGVKVTCVDVSGQRTRHVVENYKRI